VQAKNAYEENFTREDARVTARLPGEPVRVTSWLAGWVDYAFAIVLVAGRWICAPFARRGSEATMQASFGPVPAAALGPSHWEEPGQATVGSKWVKAGEVVMLSLSFFLAAHLLSGGTTTVTAPNLNPLGVFPELARAEGLGGNQVATLPITHGEGAVINVRASDMSTQADATQEAALPPSENPGEGASAAALVTETPTPEPTAEATPAPVETPAPVVTEAPPPPPAPTQPPIVERLPALTTADVKAAALAAGWPADLVDDVAAVAWCESRFRPDAFYAGAHGLMQMVALWFPAAGYDFDTWTDPVVNLRVAYFAFQLDQTYGNEPWAPWSCKPEYNTPPE